jgi:signal transduction histidine kinase
LVRDVTASLVVRTEERDQRFAINGPNGVVVSADRLFLREAFTNVVDNAIKYGPRRSTISLAVDQGAHEAIVSVADEGPACHTSIASGFSNASTV